MSQQGYREIAQIVKDEVAPLRDSMEKLVDKFDARFREIDHRLQLLDQRYIQRDYYETRHTALRNEVESMRLNTEKNISELKKALDEQDKQAEGTFPRYLNYASTILVVVLTIFTLAQYIKFP